jgi:hypothetical protein
MSTSIQIGNNDGLAGPAAGGGWQFSWNSQRVSLESQAIIETWVGKNITPPKPLILAYTTDLSFTAEEPG